MLAEVCVGLSSGLLFSLATTILVALISSRSSSLVALNSLGTEHVCCSWDRDLPAASSSHWMWMDVDGSLRSIPVERAWSAIDDEVRGWIAAFIDANLK